MNDKSLEQRISSGFDKAVEQLAAAEKASRPRIPENLFSGVFLALFANLEEQHPTATIQNWIAIAGNPFQEVDVFDEKGEILFVVPPMFSNAAINPKLMDGKEPVSHMVQIANKLAQRSPIEANNYISHKYAGLRDSIANKVSRVDYAQEWNSIFIRYGLEPIAPLPASLTEKSTTSERSLLDDLRGDDLDFTPI